MRLRRSQFWFVLSIALIAAAIAVAILLRKHAAPEPARLLSDGDAIVYVNFKTARTFTKFGEGSTTLHDPETPAFVQETGIEWVRDMDEAAFSVHGRLSGAFGDGPAAPESRTSLVLVGRFDSGRLGAYLRRHSNGQLQYRGATIYSIPLQGRTVRVAILSVDTVAASNVDGLQDVEGIIDRYRSSALPFGGPRLVREYYDQVPLASTAWAILKTSSTGERSSSFLPSGISLLVPADTQIVASVRALSAIHARTELFTPNEAVAERFKGQVETLIGFIKSVETDGKPLGETPELKDLFDALKVEQKGERVILNASIPFGFFERLLSEPPAQLVPQKQTPPEPSPAAPRRKSKQK